MRRLDAYLAGPDVFLPNAIDVAQAKKGICAAQGFVGRFPLDNDFPPADDGRALAGAIYAANVGLMRACDVAFANLTPFRGPSLDAGTAFEIGFMRALGKPVFGYSASGATYADKTPAAAREGGRAFDADGYEIEDFGLADNLMIVCGIEEGGAPVAAVDAACDLAAMAAFEACVRAAAAVCAGREAS